MSIQLEEKKKYRLTVRGEKLEFIPMSIDRDRNELYMKITHPLSAHEGVKLSSMENHENIEEIEM